MIWKRRRFEFSHWLLLVLAVSGSTRAAAPANYDEAKIGNLPLPDVLTTSAGRKVHDRFQWERERRPELLELFTRHIYGRTPAEPAPGRWVMASIDRKALGGRATRKEIVFSLRSHPSVNATLLVYQPNNVTSPPPVFLGLNFFGNHTVHADPGIMLSRAWMRESSKHHIVNHRATEGSRGTEANQWQVEAVLARGYATATLYNGDLYPDHAHGRDAGFAGVLGQSMTRQPDDWGAIAIWAWGLSRALDYLETDSELYATQVALHGHSRLGKAALWAAAQDQRFALVISNIWLRWSCTQQANLWRNDRDTQRAQAMVVCTKLSPL
jgi:hypothetical protein